MAKLESYKRLATDHLCDDAGNNININSVRLNHRGIPLCCHGDNTCTNVAKNNGRDKNGSTVYRKFCAEHYAQHVYRPHVQDQCENIDGRLGFPCEHPLNPPYLTVDHIDEDHYNQDIDNYQTLCPECHAKKTNGIGKLLKNQEISAAQARAWMDTNTKLQKQKKSPINGFI